jgi:lipopolysaccharide exporter
MEDRAVRGVPWSLLGYAANRLIGVGTIVVLAHVLVPADFGLVALGMIAINLFNVFSDLGLSATLILRQDFGTRAKGTLFTMMLGLSVVATAIAAGASPLIADLFNSPRLEGVVLGLSPLILLTGFSWFYLGVMQRELQFRRRFVALNAQSVSYAVVAILLSAFGAGVWSLVVGQLVGVTVLVVFLVYLSPYRVRPVFNGTDARSISHTSRGFLVQGTIAFIGQNADYFSVGRVLGVTQAGFYSMAFRFAEIPYLGIADPIARVTFPGFARMRHRGEDPIPTYLTSLRLVTLAACPLGILLSATADPFTRTVFGEHWLPMIGPLAVLGIWAAVRPVQITVAWFLNSVGEAGVVGRISTIVLLVVIPALLVAAHLGGITAVAWVMLADMVLSLLILIVVSKRRASVEMSKQWAAIRPIVLACGATWPAAWATTGLLSGAAPALALGASVAVGLSAYFAALTVVAPGLLMGSIAQVRKRLAQPGGPTQGGPETAGQ